MLGLMWLSHTSLRFNFLKRILSLLLRLANSTNLSSSSLILSSVNSILLLSQYFGHLMWRVDSLEKTMMLGGIGAGGEGDNRGWDGWMTSPTRWTWVCVISGSWWWLGRTGELRFMGSQRVRHNWATELNWTEQKQKNYTKKASMMIR